MLKTRGITEEVGQKVSRCNDGDENSSLDMVLATSEKFIDNLIVQSLGNLMPSSLEPPPSYKT